MKKVIFFIFVCLISGCNLAHNIKIDILEEIGLKDDGDIYSILYWVSNNIKYKEDIIDNWQDPEETFLLRAGDCEDKSILFAYLYYMKTGIKCKFVILKLIDPIVYHMVVEIDDIYYDATNIETHECNDRNINRLDIILKNDYLFCWDIDFDFIF